MYENFIYIALAVFLAAVVGSAIVGIKAVRVKEKLDVAELVSLYADLLVRAAEQAGKIKGMQGSEKKMLVMSLLSEALPDIPEWIKDAAVEAAVLLLDKTSDVLADKLESVVGG